MIFPQFVIYVLIYNYLKFRNDPSITSQEIANYISVALAVALSVYMVGLNHQQCRTIFTERFRLSPSSEFTGKKIKISTFAFAISNSNWGRETAAL